MKALLVVLVGLLLLATGGGCLAGKTLGRGRGTPPIALPPSKPRWVPGLHRLPPDRPGIGAGKHTSGPLLHALPRLASHNEPRGRQDSVLRRSGGRHPLGKALQTG